MASADRLKKYHFDEEEAETHLNVKEKTGFPRPEYRFRIVLEAINQYVEEAYFWTIDELRYDWGYNVFHKIADIFAASEASGFFGVGEQRLGMQQEKASGYLKGISEMLKALFQIVRELRIIDERLGYYEHTFKRKNNEESVGSDITLKGIWIDQVEGGVKNAASVYGLAQTVGFTVLPDLFFRVRADDRGAHEWATGREYEDKVKNIIDSVDNTLKKMEGFNQKVKEVLGRKLTQYYMWKLRTYKELKTRRTFTIKYLRQHYDTIKLYIGWIKPYLRNIRRLQLSEKHMRAADIITAFEGAVLEIEVLASKQTQGASLHPCVLIHFYYRTRPALNYMQEGYQRGPAHTGKFDMVLRGYIWSDAQIKNYLRMKEEEDLELLGEIDESIKGAMEGLGDELKAYLKEGGEKFDEEPEPKPPPQPSFLEPFGAVLGGIKNLSTAFGMSKIKGKSEKSAVELDNERTALMTELKTSIFQAYKNYKKMHGMLTW